MSKVALPFRPVAVLSVLLALSSTADGQQTPLANWKAKESDLELLANRFVAPSISIRPPAQFSQVDFPNADELVAKGIATYGWTPDGVFPSRNYVMVMLTPFARPSSEALDKTVDGMQQSLTKGNFKNLQFRPTKRGRLNGIEVRTGNFTAEVEDSPVQVFFLIGIDATGTFSAMAMLDGENSDPTLRKAIAASLLTVSRNAEAGD